MGQKGGAEMLVVGVRGSQSPAEPMASSLRPPGPHIIGAGWRLSSAPLSGGALKPALVHFGLTLAHLRHLTRYRTNLIYTSMLRHTHRCGNSSVYRYIPGVMLSSKDLE